MVERAAIDPGRYRRVLLKLSGEALMGPRQYGIDPEVARDIAGQVAEAGQGGVHDVGRCCAERREHAGAMAGRQRVADHHGGDRAGSHDEGERGREIGEIGRRHVSGTRRADPDRGSRRR